VQLRIGKLSRVLVFWSSKMHPSLLQAHIVCLFRLSRFLNLLKGCVCAKKEGLGCGLKCGFKIMSRQSHLLFFPFLQFSHLRGFATQNVKTVQSPVFLSSKMSQERVHGRM
jgi:hypothetical protein